MRRLRPAVAAALLAAFSSGCSINSPLGPTSEQSARRPSTAQLLRAEQRVLDDRATAVRRRDLAAFRRTLDLTRPRLVDRQVRWFRSVSRLPLARFDYRVAPRPWPAGTFPSSGSEALPAARVTVRMRLAGFDSGVATQTTGFGFGRRDGRLVVSADHPRGRRFVPGYDPQPWDLVRVHAHLQPGLLVLYDRPAAAARSMVSAAVRSGLRQVRGAVPYRWGGTVVVYDFASPRVIASYRDVPGGDIAHLGAITFPVTSPEGGGRVVARRIVVLPASVRAGSDFLSQIVRHELTHVAVGVHDDGVPTWLSEGVAEYVARRPIPPWLRRIDSVAPQRAATGVDTMPRSADFNGPDQRWHYAISWMACDLIASTQGPATLWLLVDALHDVGPDGTTAQRERAIRQALGYGSHELARRAAARIRQIYG